MSKDDERRDDSNDQTIDDETRALGARLGERAREAADQGRTAEAVLLFESALTVHRALGDAWGVFLDLSGQGEAFLATPGQLPAALVCLGRAAEVAKAVEAPQAEKAEARYEVVMRQLAERFPPKVEELRQMGVEEADELRVDAVHQMMEDGPAAVGFFIEQLAVARQLEEPAGEFSSLGSLAQVLSDAGEARGAVAAFVLAEAAARRVSAAPTPQIESMMSEWRRAVVAVAGAQFSSLCDEVAEDPEPILAEAVTHVGPG